MTLNKYDKKKYTKTIDENGDIKESKEMKNYNNNKEKDNNVEGWECRRVMERLRSVFRNAVLSHHDYFPKPQRQQAGSSSAFLQLIMWKSYHSTYRTMKPPSKIQANLIKAV